MSKLRRRRAAAFITIIMALFMFSITVVPELYKKEQGETSYQQKLSNDTAIEALNNLAVKGRAPKTGYSRDRFGDGWAVTQGCNTRQIILFRDLENAVLKDECTVISGSLNDPYTGQTIQYSSDNPSGVQIDHVVALSDAWQKGAQLLTEEKRQQLANDPLELLAVEGASNQQKGDADAATWLPKNKAFRCYYVARQITIKKKYELWVTEAEKAAMHSVLGQCPQQTLINLSP